MNGFVKGTPGWVEGYGPVNRLDTWLALAGAQKTSMLEDPVIIEDLKVIDICNFIALSLYQEHGKLPKDYRKALEYLNDHYFRGRYYRYLVSNEFIKCSSRLCNDCSLNHTECLDCKEGSRIDSVTMTCSACLSPGCLQCGDDSSKCDVCADGWIVVDDACQCIEGSGIDSVT
jgi:hypothetical protein